jgi:hypothetical protein
VIAQELLNVIPESVYGGENDSYYSVDYGSIVAVLIEAIKEQSAVIKQLTARLDASGL